MCDSHRADETERSRSGCVRPAELAHSISWWGVGAPSERAEQVLGGGGVGYRARQCSTSTPSLAEERHTHSMSQVEVAIHQTVTTLPGPDRTNMYLNLGVDPLLATHSLSPHSGRYQQKTRLCLSSRTLRITIVQHSIQGT